MKFEEIYELQNESRNTIEEAARMLCMSEGNLRRYIERYEEEGLVLKSKNHSTQYLILI